jgi:hypothetical protein
MAGEVHGMLPDPRDDDDDGDDGDDDGDLCDE